METQASRSEPIMRELPVGNLMLGDIGNRIVAIDERGNAYHGVLTDIFATVWKYGDRPEDKVRIRIEIQAGDHSKLKLEALPLDFRVQIEREEQS